MDLSREYTFLSHNRCVEPYTYPKRPQSLYKKQQKSLKLSIDTFNLNQLDLLADKSNIYSQELFARVIDMDKELIDADRDSIISLENDTFQIIRPASFSVNKPRALYRNKDSQSKFSVSNSQTKDKIEQLAEEIFQPVQFAQEEKKSVDVSNKEKKPIKVKTNNQASQTVEKPIRNAWTETDKVVEREKSFSKLAKNEGEKKQNFGTETQNESRNESGYFNEDTKSVEFDEKKILIEKKLKLFYPFKIGITLSIFLFLSSVIEIVLQLVLIMNETPLNKVSAGVWSGFVGLLVFFSNILISKLIK